MNNTTNQAGQLANARFLRDQLAGPSRWGPFMCGEAGADSVKVQIQYELQGPALSLRSAGFFDVDTMIASKGANPGDAPCFHLYALVRSIQFPIQRSPVGANDPGPTLGKIAANQQCGRAYGTPD